jgi:hypothetical protein
MISSLLACLQRSLLPLLSLVLAHLCAVPALAMVITSDGIAQKTFSALYQVLKPPYVG